MDRKVDNEFSYLIKAIVSHIRQSDILIHNSFMLIEWSIAHLKALATYEWIMGKISPIIILRTSSIGWQFEGLSLVLRIILYSGHYWLCGALQVMHIQVLVPTSVLIYLKIKENTYDTHSSMKIGNSLSHKMHNYAKRTHDKQTWSPRMWSPMPGTR